MTDPPAAPAARPAGFWIRAVAALADLVVCFAVELSFDAIASRVGGPEAEDPTAIGGLVGLFTLLFAATYTAVLHALPWGQTLGKMLVGIRVVSTDGEPVAFGAGLLRFAGYLASLLPFGLGFLMAGLRRDKRALHDLLAGTRVERLPRIIAEPPRPVPPDVDLAATTSDVG
jgi:uncharacterized RDD family membrane protein YckC